MKKNLIIRLVLSIALVTFMGSCSSEEDLFIRKEEKYSKKFQVFTSKKEEAVNYGNGFKTLLERYDEIKNVQHTLKSIKKAWKNSSKIADEFVEFNIRSQDITTNNKEKYTLFPLIKNYTVGGIIIAVLKENDTQVEFLKMSSDADNYNEILGLFRAQYLKSNLKNKNLNKGAGGPCGFDGAPPCDIETVVITIGGGGGGGSLPPGGGWVPPGGCGPYEDCLHNPDAGGTAGSGDTPNNNQNANPCEKTKSNLENPNIKSKIAELKTQSTQGGEKGVMFKADGTPSATKLGGDHNVDFGNKTGYQGGYHNHTPTGIPMLSPPDIDQLLQFALAQGNGNPTNASNAYIGMVAPNGMHYVISFNGTYNDALVTFSQEQLKQLKDDYRDLANDLTSIIVSGTQYINSDGSINHLGAEKLFFTILKKMNLEGKINLQRIESTGTIQNINLNSNNQPTPTPCS
ncbi:hypothetical protein CEY12_13675 [Chryseobacterium sp. T16E-39]|uniref:hypothetical protein n=1 Tax=Chryseobacterium sp. T16E-39 TaxID=2015076 RepID=UPI000B5B3F2D|nr:hypothetical protein [Chryseobacterium sp. T16E-39]ASK31091.1 hypothetical protein CEY12_13675 [Chryseobacterium sp. T16E-39]